MTEDEAFGDGRPRTKTTDADVKREE